jgi:hypothetical protein
MSGCASLIARPGKVILLPEERIFTVQAGQEIAVMLDDKPMKMTFPDDMKLVSPTVLVRQEAKLNDEMLKNTKASAENKKKLGIIGSIFAALAAGLGIFIQAKKWFPSKITTTIGK